MGQTLPSLINALSCKTLYTHVLNAMTCESECGMCAFRCRTDEVEVSDSDTSVDMESCCGGIHYTTDAHEVQPRSPKAHQ